MKRDAFLAVCTAVILAGCGGGGSNSGHSGPSSPQLAVATKTKAGGAATPTPPPGKATPTLAVVPTDTPTPGPPVLVVHPGDVVLPIIRSAPSGSIVAFAAGTYAGFTVQASDVQGSITLLADVTGRLTDGGALPVTIAAGNGAAAALEISGVSGLVVDGFTVQGGGEEALLVINSPQTTVQNCTVQDSAGDGLFVEGSDQAVVLDNLVVGNRRAGIRVYGSNELQAINNTVYGNHDNGVSVGSAQEPDSSVTVVNNIINANQPSGIVVDASTLDYSGNFNLNSDGYGPDTPSGPNDIALDPLFIDPQSGDFHLSDNSPAVDTGSSGIDADAVILLEQRTTRVDGSADLPPLDLGFHYPTPPPTPTPLPRSTRPRKTATPTPARVG